LAVVVAAGFEGIEGEPFLAKNLSSPSFITAIFY